MLSGEFTEYYYKLLGVGMNGISDEDLANIINDLDPSEFGSTVVEISLTRLGDPYSIPLAGTGSYTDCSHLVQWAYAKVGVTLPRNANTQGKYCYDNAQTISKADLQPGDLVFWTYYQWEGFLNISHVGIYAGNNMVIHASSVEMQVVCEPLSHADKQVLYGRPS